MKATVFLGGGRITGALIAGLRLAGDRRAIVVHDRNPGKVRALRREFGVEGALDFKSALLRAEALRAEILIVAVRPGSVAELLEEIAGLFAYLASDDAAFATGQVYTMDGGETAGGLASR